MSVRNSILCPSCRKLISTDEEACPYCGLKSPGSRWKTTLSQGFSMTNFDAVKILIAINIGYFLLSLLLNPLALGVSANPLTFLSPSDTSLFLLGATGTIPITSYGRWWSLLSASFLHAGILHIVFNMVALWQMGYFILQEFGFSRFITLYLLTGVGGFTLSYLAGIPFTIGASASICGFIGAIIYYGKSRGGFYGDMIYRQAMGWVIGLAIFGFLIQGINNWAHGGGLLSGIVLGFLLGYKEKRDETLFHKILAVACIVMTLGALAWAFIQALSILTGSR